MSEEPRPTVGELLSRPPPWPREWAQRLGREASRLGAREEVHRGTDAQDWEVRWVLGRRPLLSLRPGSQQVFVDLALHGATVHRLLESATVDEEFRQALRAAPEVRGRRRLRLPLSSARRANSLSEALRSEALSPER